MTAPIVDCIKTYEWWLALPDPNVLLAVLGAVVANRVEGDPTWLLLVGPPSSGKTEILMSVSHLPEVHLAATLTEPALLSGVPKKEHAEEARGGLLRHIGEFGVLLLKDFTSTLAQNRDTRAAVLAALREIYDGSWTRHVGADGGRTLHWEGKVGLVAGVTPAIDQHHSVIAALGERFLQYRLTEVDADAVGARALEHLGREREMRDELAAASYAVVNAADQTRARRPLDADEQAQLVRLATFATRARSDVPRDGYSHEVVALPQPEAPARFVLGLRRIVGGMEAIGATPAAVEAVLLHLALDAMPATRRRLLEALQGRPEPTRTAELADESGLPTKTAARHLEDLALLGLADRSKDGDKTNSPDRWAESDWCRDHWPAAKWDRDSVRSDWCDQESGDRISRPDTTRDGFLVSQVQLDAQMAVQAERVFGAATVSEGADIRETAP